MESWDYCTWIWWLSRITLCKIQRIPKIFKYEGGGKKISAAITRDVVE